jgi:O-antigen ligase
VALGVLSAYQCAEQLIAGNKVTIEQYEHDPQSMLDTLGIEPDTLQHFLFEHRLYASNVRGYFTTRNSAGSFLLMSLFASMALFLDNIKNKKVGTLNPKMIFAYRVIIAIIFFSLILTKSKGAVIGLILALFLLSALFLFRKLPEVYKKITLVLCLLICFALGGILIRYGLAYGRLPGGNSMLVRWQYWHGSAKMYADHPWTGVGPGNFSNYYSHYKPAAALESVTDPHNFPLSILTQYGPLGLIGFIAMIFVPLLKVAFTKSKGDPDNI